MTEQQAQVAIGATQADGAGPASTPADSADSAPAVPTGTVQRPVWASLLQPGGADVPVVPYSPPAFPSRRDEAAAPAFGGAGADRILASLKGMVFSEPDPAPPTTTSPVPGATSSATPLAARSPVGAAGSTPSAATAGRPAAGAPLAGANALERAPRTSGTSAAAAGSGGRPRSGPNPPGPTLSLASPGARTAQEQEQAGTEKSAPPAGKAGPPGPGSAENSEVATSGPAAGEAQNDDILPAPRKRAFSFRWR
ncbi:MAG: hypothetical protein M0005_08840 [Actinomycetota bacterium]|jgi:hypothetical protein|nr:hypothetical protein [Actinomycetota bacterium]